MNYTFWIFTFEPDTIYWGYLTQCAQNLAFPDKVTKILQKYIVNLEPSFKVCWHTFLMTSFSLFQEAHSALQLELAFRQPGAFISSSGY